jgi:hypothetical protein
MKGEKGRNKLAFRNLTVSWSLLHFRCLLIRPVNFIAKKAKKEQARTIAERGKVHMESEAELSIV